MGADDTAHTRHTKGLTPIRAVVAEEPRLGVAGFCRGQVCGGPVLLPEGGKGESHMAGSLCRAGRIGEGSSVGNGRVWFDTDNLTLK